MVGISDAQTLDRGPAAPFPGVDGAPARGAAVAALPVLVAAALLLVASWADGAFPLRSWGPLAVFALVALAVARGSHARGGALWMAGCAWAFAAWSTLSALWADMPGAALEGGARNLLYAGLISLPLMTLPTRTWAVRGAQALTAGVGGLVLLTLGACIVDGPAQFLAGRLDAPVGYRNGTAALFALAFWPLVCVAARRRTRSLVRAGSFALAVAALALAYLTQSRGVLIGFSTGAIVAFALGPDRLRRAWLTILALVGVALSSSDLLAPYDAFVRTSTTVPPAVTHATSTLAALTVAGFAAALVLALFDGGLRLSPAAKRRLRSLAAGLLAVLALATLVGVIARVGDPIRFAGDKVGEFKQLEVAAPGESRLGSTSGQRYDLWRIAWAEFASTPLTGVGESSYAPGYYERRATDRNLSTPHSLPASTLAETGLIGALLLAGVVVAAGVALARGWGAATLDERRWASACVAAGAVLLGQSLVDWLWNIPGLTGLGLMCLAVGVATVSVRRGEVLPRRRTASAMRVAPVLAAGLVALLVLSDLYVRTARAETSAAPAHRLELADAAARLNPLALPPRYIRASALEEQGRRDAARRELLAALEREPRSFVTMALLGDLERRAGNRPAARSWYRRALAANPLDTGLQQLAGVATPSS
jgi:hypothetical protein